MSGDRTAGFTSRPKGCPRCGFGFLFELLDDYYPAPNAAFFVCDQEARVTDAGKGSFELTGLKDEDVIGRPIREVLGLRWSDAGSGGGTATATESASAGAETGSPATATADPIQTTLEWGVRSLSKRVEVHAEGDIPADAVADVFPAYDEDGGLLVVLTPEN